MHISNDRYFRDRQRHDLALRMIRHEARTHTIRSCTGLTDDRIRRLYKTLRHAHGSVRRRRGKSPRQISYFTRNVEIQFEASYMSGVFTTFGLLRRHGARAGEHESLEYGERFCDAFETHHQLVRSARISFEHAWFLLHLLTTSTSLRTARCRHCTGHYLRDHLNAAARRCPFCEIRVAASAERKAPARVRQRNHDRVTAAPCNAQRVARPM